MDDEYQLMRMAIKEAILFLEAPADSPRLWPVSRANLYKLLQRAYACNGKSTPRADNDDD